MITIYLQYVYGGSIIERIIIQRSMKFDIHESFDMQTSLALISNENVAKDEWKIRSFIFALMFLRL